MWALRLRVANPPHGWCRGASLAHPDAAMRVTAMFPLPGGRCIEVVELRTPAWRDVAERIRSTPGVAQAEVLLASPHGATLRLVVPACGLARGIVATGALPQLPFSVGGGCDELVVVGSRERARMLLEALRRKGVDTQVLSSGPYEPPRHLTERQQQVLDAAVREGYYDYPRRINLTKLAAKLGVTKSTLSESLMIVERELLAGGGARGRACGGTARPAQEAGARIAPAPEAGSPAPEEARPKGS